jgi:tRNA-dihydrouridine synthase
MVRTYFQMLVDEIAQEEAAESARAAALIASGQIVNGEQMLKAQRHRDCVGKMKQFAAWFTHGIPNGSALRRAIFEAKSGPAVLAAVESFFATRHDQPAQEAPPAEAFPLFADTCG